MTEADAETKASEGALRLIEAAAPAPPSPEETSHLVAICVATPPETLLESYRNDGDQAFPERLTLIDLRAEHRSSQPEPIDEAISGLEYYPLDSPGSLGRLGTVVVDSLSNTSGESGARHIHIDALSPLVEATDANRVFRFLVVLKGYCSNHNVQATVWSTPGALDTETREILSPVFDSISTRE